MKPASMQASFTQLIYFFTGVSLLERLSFMLSFGCYLAASPGHAAAEKNGETTIPFQGRVLLKLHTPRN